MYFTQLLLHWKNNILSNAIAVLLVVIFEEREELQF